MRLALHSVRAALLAASFLAAAPAVAQRVDARRVFDFSIQLPQQVMQASIREGQPLKLTLGGTDEFQMVPVVSGSGGEVTLAVYRGTANEPATRRLVERIPLAVGTPARLRSHTGIRVVLDRVREAAAPAAARRVAFTPT
ncbi:MAG: hypothetical protein KY444_12445, partial [Gemmatimonadetes bacterium]|nr:hypothetical protein [Gemmatimonadota bacterium]